MAMCGGLNSSSGGELKLYLDCTVSTFLEAECVAKVWIKNQTRSLHSIWPVYNITSKIYKHKFLVEIEVEHNEDDAIPYSAWYSGWVHRMVYLWRVFRHDVSWYVALSDATSLVHLSHCNTTLSKIPLAQKPLTPTWNFFTVSENNFLFDICSYWMDVDIKTWFTRNIFTPFFSPFKKGWMNSYECCSHITLKNIKKIKDAADKNGVKNGTCNLCLNSILCEPIWKWSRFRVRFRSSINEPLFIQSKHEIEMLFIISDQWRIQDFPGGGGNPWVWEKTYYLARFLLKTAWEWKKLNREGGTSLEPPFDPPMIMCRGKDQRKYLTFVIAAGSGRKNWQENWRVHCNWKIGETWKGNNCLFILPPSLCRHKYTEIYS